MANKLHIPDPIKRKLYMASGGFCYICKTALISEEMVFIGKIAHIIGENKGSARYSSTFTDEEKSSFENLILVCGNCHDVIDKGDPTIYTVDYVQQIKDKHERKIKNTMDTFYVTVGNGEYKKAKNLYSYYKFNEFDEDSIKSEQQEDLSEVNNLITLLDTLSIDTRRIIKLIMLSGEVKEWSRYEISLEYLYTITTLSKSELESYLKILDNKKLIYIDEDRTDGIYIYLRYSGRGGFDWFQEIARFYLCKEQTLESFIIDLDLSLMDLN